MTSDYYSILGVSPAAEDVVIRAAYRALMRHYHPDTNPDPEAQRRAQEITAAFAVLRDSARRAEYDAQRAGADLRIVDQPPPWEPQQRRPPAMRGLGIASAAVALGLVVALWMAPAPIPPKARGTAPPARQIATSKPAPIEELEPEAARLARLRGQSEESPLPVQLTTPASEADLLPPPVTTPTIPIATPVAVASIRRPIKEARATPPRPAPAAPQQLKIAVAAAEATEGCRPGESVVVSAGCKNDRVAALDRMAAGFFSQSMAHADAAKKELLMSSHTRSASTRSACHSDSCLSNAYLRQMREISAIMEGRSPKTE